MAPLFGYKIRWPKDGVFRGQKTAEGSNAKNGGFADAPREKKTNENNKNMRRVTKKVCIFDFENKKKTNVF